MILLIISCTKSCGLVAISPCHFHLHHMLLMPSLITLDHITLATLVSLNFQNQTWAFTPLVVAAQRVWSALSARGAWMLPPRRCAVVVDSFGRSRESCSSRPAVPLAWRAVACCRPESAGVVSAPTLHCCKQSGRKRPAPPNQPCPGVRCLMALPTDLTSPPARSHRAPILELFSVGPLRPSSAVTVAVVRAVCPQA
jgi:hypothetical protein